MQPVVMLIAPIIPAVSSSLASGDVAWVRKGPATPYDCSRLLWWLCAGIRYPFWGRSFIRNGAFHFKHRHGSCFSWEPTYLAFARNPASFGYATLQAVYAIATSFIWFEPLLPFWPP